MRTLALLVIGLLWAPGVGAQFLYEGTVQGWVTGGSGPDLAGTQVVRNLPFVKVTAATGDFVFCDENGGFAFDLAVSSADFTVSLDGLHLTVVTNLPGGSPYTETFSGIAPGQNLNFTLNQNPVPQSDTTAQLNAVNVWNTIRATLIQYNPNFEPFLSDQFEIRVSDPPDACCTLGEFGVDSIPYVNLGGGGGVCGLRSCYDATYATAAAHEIGHYISFQLGQAGQSTAFGEGIADALGMLVFDDPVIARSLFDTGEHLREPVAAMTQADCPTTTVHTCGQALSGMWWNLGVQLNDRDTLLTLFAKWFETTRGITFEDIAFDPDNLSVALTPDMLTEILRVDTDSDGDICNGTDHSDEIRAAFLLHGIDVPAFPDPVPAEVFVRGDASNNGIVGLEDAIYVLDYLFSMGPDPSICDAADADDSGMVDVGDTVFLLSFLFMDGPEPSWPYPEECSDITPDNCTL